MLDSQQAGSFRFIDTSGYFCLREESSFTYHVPSFINVGRFRKFRGKQVKLRRITTYGEGDLVEVTPTNKKATKSPTEIDFNAFLSYHRPFAEIQTWTEKKKVLGTALFHFLNSHNPIRIVKFKHEVVGRTNRGNYLIDEVSEGKNGLLRQFRGRQCLFVVTYNRSFYNGFLVLPVQNVNQTSDLWFGVEKFISKSK